METIFIHPERQEGELFFTNASADGFAWIVWQSKRKGTVAYDGEGRQLKTHDWFPVFIHERELVRAKLDIRDIRREFREFQDK